MNTDAIVALLVAERDRLNRAIDALGSTTSVKRRGRPPKSASAVASAPAPASTPSPTKNKRVMSADGRKRQIEAMKKYWAAKKAAATPGKKTAKASK